MLRRVNAGLFEAPAGAHIQLLVEAQGNNGVEEASFQYGTEVLDPLTVDGAPGCEFDVSGDRDVLEIGVVFDPAAPGSARYDVFEFENGVRSSLNLFVKNSDSAPLLFFTIDPVGVLAGAGAVPRGAARDGGARSMPPPPPPPPPPARKMAAKKRAPKRAAAKRAAAKPKAKSTVRKATAKSTARKPKAKKAAPKAPPRKPSAPPRKASTRATPRRGTR